MIKELDHTYTLSRRNICPAGMGITNIFRRRQRFLIVAGVLSIVIYLWISLPLFRPASPTLDEHHYETTYPKAWKLIYRSGERARGGEPTTGGIWYIPPSWLGPNDKKPETILEAAKLASEKAEAKNHTIPFSKIPLIIHQTWKDTKLTSWPVDIAAGIEEWLKYSMENGEGYGSMAYFLWLDNGCDQLIKDGEPELVEPLEALPLPVMRSDVFRVVVVNEIGGIYGDIDTHPLRNPKEWLEANDVVPWTDPETKTTYSIFSGNEKEKPDFDAYRPAKLLLGIEADTKPGTDTHWRMGYTYPVQLTQWALASAPHHPVLDKFVSNFASRLKEIAQPFSGNYAAAAAAGALQQEDPLALTGPAAITNATFISLNETCGLRWDAVSGLAEANEFGRAGRSKVIGSTVILPITAFSPGRGRYGNMGSKGIDDPSARLQHKAQGSWRKVDWKVEMGKLCRTTLGLCKEWSKVPS